MDKIWLKDYPPGVPASVDWQRYPSLVSLVQESLGCHAGRTAFISMGVELGYTELDRLSRHFAAWLQHRGLDRGARVALMMPNVLQYPVCLLGALRAGCIVVNCNPLYTPRELEYQLNDSGAEGIVILENFASTLQEIMGRTKIAHVVVTSVGEMLGPVKGRMVDFALRHVKKKVPGWSLPGALTLHEALAEVDPRAFRPVALEPRDLAFLQYTGGTTGVSKGAMLSHGNMVANVLQAEAWLHPKVRESGEIIVTALPLYHVFALTANCLTFLRLGAANLLIVNPRDIPAFVRELSKHPFTALTGVNTLFNALLNDPDFAKLDFSSLRITLGGGMAVQQAVAQRWKAVTGKPLVQAYGLTETSPAVTIDPLDLPDFDGSIGMPLPSTELSIRDDRGVEVSMGQVGEICVRGPQVMTGYWHRPAETALVFHPDHFLRTGDLGYVDAHGHVFLVDRKKDLIMVSGFKVFPNEVEDVVAMHPGVSEVAAIGVPDEHSGETVKIFVVRKDPRLTAEELIAHCRRLLTAYKVPHRVEFRDDMPRSPVGKILRRALRDAV